jgi:hypothetical protein
MLRLGHGCWSQDGLGRWFIRQDREQQRALPLWVHASRLFGTACKARNDEGDDGHKQCDKTDAEGKCGACTVVWTAL